MINYAETYLEWLESEIHQKKIDENTYEISTPYLDRYNDYTNIYIETKPDKSIRITDGGYIIDNLEMSGFNFESAKRKEILQENINRFGVRMKDGEMYVDVLDYKNLPIAKHKLIQAMLGIDDMFYLNQQNVISVFADDVFNYLDKLEVGYISNIDFTGKSSYTHKFDFAVPKSKDHEENIFRIINNPSRTQNESALFAWQDIKPIRPRESNLYLILNDENKVASSILEPLHNYDVGFILWSDRDRLLPKLVS